MKWLVAALAALAIWVPVAEAHQSATSRVHNARHVALAYWGALRCDTGFWSTPILRERGLTARTYANAQAEWYIIDSRPAWEDCSITIDDRPWSTEYLCRLIVHEFGHLAGAEHVDDATNIMYPGTLPRFRPCAPRRSR